MQALLNEKSTLAFFSIIRYNKIGDEMIGYPTKKGLPNINGSARSANASLNQSRGMGLEDDINESNEYYLETNRACIHKKPTPIQVVRVDYPNRAHAKIVEAYYKVPSTTDYNGVYRGKAIDFEAKETRNKTLFHFKNIHPHQIEHLKRVLYQGGIGFLIIRFTALNETYLVDAAYIIENYENPSLKSLSYAKIKEHGSLIREGLTPRLHYLDNVDEMYFKEE